MVLSALPGGVLGRRQRAGSGRAARGEPGAHAWVLREGGSGRWTRVGAGGGWRQRDPGGGGGGERAHVRWAAAARLGGATTSAQPAHPDCDSPGPRRPPEYGLEDACGRSEGSPLGVPPLRALFVHLSGPQHG